MPKYTFLCHRTVHFWGHVIDVEAKSEEVAREKAEKWFEPDWDEAEIEDESQELVSVDGVPVAPATVNNPSPPGGSGLADDEAAALDRLLEYLWQAEEADYQDLPPEERAGHIFELLQLLDGYFERCKTQETARPK